MTLATEKFEPLFLQLIEKFPHDLPELLENDFDYSLENQLVAELAELLDDAKLSEETLEAVQFGGFLRSRRASEFRNGEDYVLQAVLASKSTTSNVLNALILNNPHWLTGGWWCVMRLAQNPNTSADLLFDAARLANLDPDSEIVDEILRHPNCNQKIEALYE